MGKAVSRNEPCPCGSGKKFKHCHLGKPDPVQAKKRMVVPLFIAMAGIGGGVYAGSVKGFGVGVAVSAGALIVAGIIVLLRDPPPPSGRGGDSGAINFGG